MEELGEEKKEKEEVQRVPGTSAAAAAAAAASPHEEQQQQQDEGESSRERPALTIAMQKVNGDTGGDCDNHDDDSSSSSDGGHEYFILTKQVVPKKAPPTITTTTSATAPQAADDESNYFFSEPSISEDSSSLMQQHSQHSQQQQQQQQQHPPLTQQQQTPPQHPPTPGTTTPTPMQQQQHLFSSYQQQYAAAALKQQQQSPGNTSLSSWDTEPSLHQKLRHRRVLLQFPQPVRRRRRRRAWSADLGSEEQTSTTVEDEYQPEILFGNSGSSSKSTTPLPSPSEQRHVAGEGYGQQQQQDAYESLQAPLLSPSSMNGGGVEESIVMTLSDDSDDAADNNNNNNNNNDDSSNNPNEILVAAEAAAQAFLNTSWDLTTTTSQYHSADDEKSERQSLPPLPRLINKRPHQHRRSRSGDAAAANVMGIRDWRGMEQDKIPLPDEHESDDEEEEDENDNKIAGKSHRHAKDKNGAGNGQQQQQQQKQEYPSRSQRRQQLKAPPPRSEPSPRPPQERTHLYNSNNNHSNSHWGPPITISASGMSPYGSMNSQQQKQQQHTVPSSYGSLASEASPPPNLHGSYPPRTLPRNHHFGNNVQDNQRAWMMQMSQLHPNDPSYASYSTAPLHHLQQKHHRTASGDTRDSGVSQFTEDQEESENSTSEGMNVQQNRMQLGDVDLSNLAAREQQLEDQKFRGTYQNVMRPRHDSIFANLGKKSASKVPRSAFLPTSLMNQDQSKYPTYVCPACGTRQRAFFSINDAPHEKAGPSSYLAVYFAIYVIASLFIFGLEEGWKPLDCIYFAVVTLTTAGLGDFTPTTDANKIICSIFIYFGVACIGLLLGSYIAGMLDERATQDRKSKLIASCPNCASLKTLKESAKIETRKRAANIPQGPDIPPPTQLHRFMTERSPNGVVNEVHPAVYRSEHHNHRPRPLSPRGHASHHSSHHSSHRSHHSGVHVEFTNGSSTKGSPAHTGGSSNGSSVSVASSTNLVLGSPVTRRILGRQRHTRHESIDIANAAAGLSKMYPGRVRKFSEDFGNSATPIINEGLPLRNNLHQSNFAFRSPDEVDSDDWSDDDVDDSFSDSDSSASSPSCSSLDELLDERFIKLRNAKYLFLTLRQALVNSMVIIAVGCIGFWFIEGFSLIDSWYFTTVFLTVSMGRFLILCPVR